MRRWYDIYTQQQIDTYNEFQTASAVGRGSNFLVMTPTGHCQDGGDVYWPGWNEGGESIMIY